MTKDDIEMGVSGKVGVGIEERVEIGDEEGANEEKGNMCSPKVTCLVM